MSKTTVIIVDDHTLLRETWGKLLSFQINYDVVFNTGDGRDAITAVKDLKPNLLLLDINMTPLDGFEVLKSVRKVSPSTKVIGVSMHSQPGYVRKLMKGGAKAYVTKQSTTEELLFAMQEVFEGKTYICRDAKNILSNQLLENESIERINSLTPKQLQVIGLMKLGRTSKEIATELNLSRKTIEVHRHNIFKKLNVNNSLALMKIVNDHGL